MAASTEGNAVNLVDQAAALSDKIKDLALQVEATASEAAALASRSAGITEQVTAGVDPFVFGITIFAMACLVGYYVVWKVTPALHAPLMSVANAISGVVVLGALIAAGPDIFGSSKLLGFFAVILASVNIFGGFIITHRMLDMFKKKS